MQLVEDGKFRTAVVAPRQTSQACEVHWEEYPVGRHKRNPKVKVAHGFVHHAAVHLWEPMVYPGKHPEDGRQSHHNMEVCYHKVGVVHVDV